MQLNIVKEIKDCFENENPDEVLNDLCKLEHLGHWENSEFPGWVIKVREVLPDTHVNTWVDCAMRWLVNQYAAKSETLAIPDTEPTGRIFGLSNESQASYVRAILAYNKRKVSNRPPSEIMNELDENAFPLVEEILKDVLDSVRLSLDCAEKDECLNRAAVNRIYYVVEDYVVNNYG